MLNQIVMETPLIDVHDSSTETKWLTRAIAVCSSSVPADTWTSVYIICVTKLTCLPIPMTYLGTEKPQRTRRLEKTPMRAI